MGDSWNACIILVENRMENSHVQMIMKTVIGLHCDDGR